MSQLRTVIILNLQYILKELEIRTKHSSSLIGYKLFLFQSKCLNMTLIAILEISSHSLDCLVSLLDFIDQLELNILSDLMIINVDVSIE